MFKAACMAAYKTGKLRVVSHGWSFYLAKLRATGQRVWTLKYTGQKAEGGAWKSGTTIRQVKKALAQKGMTLPVNPSMEYASIGSCIATCSHGHPGAQTAMYEWVEVARVLHLDTGEVSIDSYKDLVTKFGNKSLEGRFVVLDVVVKQVPNVKLERLARRIDSEEATRWWTRGTHIRLLFIGVAGPLGIVWNTIVGQEDKNKHDHPHTCSTFCFWLTADCLPTLPCSWLGDLSRFDGYATLGNANSSVNPTFYPIFSIWGQICCVYNLELFVPWVPDERQLYALIKNVHDFHKKYYGRTELRIDRHTMYIDISLRSVSKIKLYFGMLSMYHGIKHAAQHSGKFRMASIAPLTEIHPTAALRPVGCKPSTIPSTNV